MNHGAGTRMWYFIQSRKIDWTRRSGSYMDKREGRFLKSGKLNKS